MTRFIRNPLARFRLLSFTEGVSFLLLLGIAMPLKYFAGIPEVVEVVGMAHGVLFILYVMAAFHLMLDKRWSFTWFAAAFVAAVLPFGPFVLEARMRRNGERRTPSPSATS